MSGGGRNRTHRTGITRPTRFEDEGGHQTPFTSGAGLPPIFHVPVAAAPPAAYHDPTWASAKGLR